MPTPWDLLARRMADLKALQGAVTVLTWDQETYLPAKGAEARGEQLATLQALGHQLLVAPEVGDALDACLAAPPPEAAPGAAGRGAVLAALRFDRERARLVPESLVRALAALQSRSLPAWREARARGEFGLLAPHLEELVRLKREQAACWLPALPAAPGGPAPEPYDALLEGYEEGMRVARLAPLLGRLAGWLAPLVAEIAARPPPPDPFAGHRFDGAQQIAFTHELLQAMGFDLEAGRQDLSAHPFSLSADPGDVRLTTRILEGQPISAIMGTIHEAGHGLYEQGLPRAHRRDPLCAAPSMGLHESQSRLWENQVGRSRPFWRRFLPRLAARFPALAGVPLDAFLRGVNRVERSRIRVEADEVTYNLHIALRFELELALLRGELQVADLPAAWDERTERLLGLPPAGDAQGCLQDIHWPGGDIGYFPTYAIGNLYAAQLHAAAARDLPGLEEGYARGELAPLLGWLREKVHRHGRALPAEEIVRRATGLGLDDGAFREHLLARYGELYGLAAGPAPAPAVPAAPGARA